MGGRSLYRIVLIYFVSFLCKNFVFCWKLSSPRVLLPYNKGLPNNFTLEVSGSKADDCFEWVSRNPEIVQVIPLFSGGKDSNCSKKAILSSVADLKQRRVTEISVKGGGKTSYCDVITDQIHSLELVSLTDELPVDGPPLKLSVIAKDKQGHVFSSIGGLEILWEVRNHVATPPSSSDETLEDTEDEIVRLTKFDTSDYEVPKEAKELEKRGLLSSSILVDPLKIGAADITATMCFSGVPTLKAKDFMLSVVPSLDIYPSSSLYLLRETSVNIKLKSRRNEDVNYSIEEVEDPNIVSLTEDLSIYAKDYGHSEVSITSKDNYRTKLDVHVVKLARVDFRVSHGNYKTLEEMKMYEIFLDLFDEDGNIIHAPDNIRFSVPFPSKFFHLFYICSNGTYAVVQTIAPGRTKLKAEFKGLDMKDGTFFKETKLSISRDITISQRLNIFPPTILLPVLPESPMHRIPLTVTGGTGNYVYSISNYEVAKIVPDSSKNNGVILEIYEESHDLTVTVTDNKNIQMINHAKVSVQTPIDLDVFPTVTEAEVGNVLILPVALLGYEDRERGIERKFDDCSKCNIQVVIIDPYVVEYEKEADIPAFGKGCKSLQFRCKAAGYTRISVNYSTNANPNETFSTTTVLACYKPLRAVYPVRVGVVTLGSSMEVAFEGGPRRWPLFKEGHDTKLEASNPDILEITLLKDPYRYNRDLTVFRVTCKNLGENVLTFKIGNAISATLKHPAESEESIKLICSKPHSIHLKLNNKNSKRKLKDENIVKVPFYGEKTFQLDLYVKDELGRKFANISSLRLKWSSSNKDLAIPDSEYDYQTHENAVSGFRKVSRNYKTFKMTGSSGDLTVTANITCYKKDVFTEEFIRHPVEIDGIFKSIELKLVSLREINAGLYDADKEKVEDGYCESDNCKS